MLSREHLEALLSPARSVVDVLALVDLLDRLIGDAPVDARGAAVSFRPSTSLGFSANEVAHVEINEAGRAELTTVLFGLAGAATPLPLHYAEEFDADDEFGGTSRALIGLLHDHVTRLLILVARSVEPAWGRAPAERESWLSLVRAWNSLGADSRSLPAELASRLTPMIATGMRTPQILRDALRVAVAEFLGEASLQIQPWAGTWTTIAAHQIFRLSTETAYIGTHAILGGRCMHLDGKARVLVGPLTIEQLDVFSRNGPAFGRIKALLLEVFPEPLEWELALDVQVPPGERCKLGERRLSTDLWLESDVSSGSGLVQIVVSIGEIGT